MDVKNHNNKAKEEMLINCRQYYQGYHRMLLDINKFERDYRPNKSIEWYTKNTFVYKLINQALRTQDIEQLYIFRYYIANLSNQLVDEFKKIEENQTYLYRGTTITKQEANKFEENIGHIFAVNSYWSTSRDREYALTFTGNSVDHHDSVRVLFEIKCNLNDCDGSIIFADTSVDSEFEYEKEVLFDIGSVFQTVNVRKENEGEEDLYIIEISTTKQGQDIVKTYIHEINEEMKYESPRIMLGILIKRIGKYKKSLEYFEELLKNPGEEKISHIHNRIGIALRLKNEYDAALEHYNIAYDLTSQLGSLERIYLAFIRHDQGQIYVRKRNIDLALKYYEEAVDIVKKEKGEKNRYTADYYSSFAKLYRSKKNYDKAMEYQEKALRIRKACLPPNHVLHAFSYFGIAEIFSCQEKYKEALDNHLKALEIREKYLLPNHLNTALSLYHVGQMYYKLNNSEKALDYYSKSLKMKRRCLPDCHPYITPVILQGIGAVIYNDKPEDALEYQLEALYIQLNVAENVNCSALSSLLSDIIKTYRSIGKNEDLLNFYERALQIRKKYLYKDISGMFYLLDEIGSTYKLMNKKKESLKFYEEALQILKEYFNNDQFNLARLYAIIASIYKSIDKKQDSLQFYKKAFQIQKTYLYDDKFNLARTLKGLATVNEEMGQIQWALKCYYKIKNMCTYPVCFHHRLCRESIRNIQRIEQTHR